MVRVIDLTGQTFGRWTVVRRSSNCRHGSSRWLCQCECGGEDIIHGTVLRDGRSRSCGFFQSEITAGRSRKHGHSHSGKISSTYHSWSGMRNRCNNPNDIKYPDYGGRGIRVCKRWSDFRNFLADMGERPPGTTIERKKVNGNYEPSNCRWATAKQQARNRRSTRRIKANGTSRCTAEWSELSGINASTIAYRIKTGWNAGKALTTPVVPNKPRRVTCGGKTLRVAEWARLLGVSKHRIYQRLNAGWSPEEALDFGVINE